MIQELLESSRLESATMMLKRQPVAIVALLRDIVDRIGSGGSTSRSRATAPRQRPSTPTRNIERVLTNLITNALKYSPRSQPVVLGVAERPDETVVSVIDRGDGITPEELAGLFQRFTRGRAGPKGDVAGLGLGLYIARGPSSRLTTAVCGQTVKSALAAPSLSLCIRGPNETRPARTAACFRTDVSLGDAVPSAGELVQGVRDEISRLLGLVGRQVPS